MSEIEPRDSPVAGSLALAAIRPTPSNPRFWNRVPPRVTPAAGQIPVFGTKTSRFWDVNGSAWMPAETTKPAATRPIRAARARATCDRCDVTIPPPCEMLFGTGKAKGALLHFCDVQSNDRV